MHSSIQPNATVATTEVRRLSTATGLTTLTINEPGGSDAHLTLPRAMWQQVVNQLVAAGVVNPTEAQQVA